jgi:hypothetical protein
MKTRMNVLILLALLVFFLSACGDQGAIDRAKADEIERQAEIDAQAKLANEGRKQADWEATRQGANVAKTVFFVIVGIVLALALAAVLLAIGYLVWRGAIALGRAIAVYAEQRAIIKAGIIKIDKETRTFPALVAGDAVHNLKTGAVYPLGRTRGANPQLATISGQVRALGIAAQAAERIGKGTKDAQAADALPGLAALPLVLPPGEPSTVIVESDTSETLDL